MIELNWNNFKAKFNGKETILFENLAYHLFCYEFRINKGIFRFKNQAGLETEPIQIGTEFVGFQAKYYDTKVSENKDDIIDSIKKAKQKNPDLTRILFYLNQEFSESRNKVKKDPQYKTDIESEAKKNNVSIEWRMPSHFEIQLALPENDYLSDFFFSLGKNAFDFLNGIRDHTENILYSIQNEIKFNDSIIKIDRTKIIEDLKGYSEKSNIIIISGEGGSGKTAIIKEFYENLKEVIPFYIFKAAEFNVSDIKIIFSQFGSYSLTDFLELHECEKNKIIVIDSAEKLSDIENKDAFKELLSALLKKSWNIIFTTRYSYLDDLRFQFIEVYRLPFKEINIENLSNEELILLSNTYSFQLPSDKKLNSIIKNLFYLDEYLQNFQSFYNNINYINFKEILWNKKIQNSSFRKNNLHISREDCFIGIVKARCESGMFFIKAEEFSEEVLSRLEKDEILKYDPNHGGYFITHDIYEEWALEKIIEREFRSAKKYKTFLERIGTSLAMRRAFRNWLSEKLLEDAEEVKSFIERIFLEGTIDSFWKDELLVSVLLSDYSNAFFNQFGKAILEQNQSLLIKITFLLRITCKEVDNSIFEILETKDDLSIDLNYVFTKPKGSGWSSTIYFIYQNIEIYNPGNIQFIVLLLQDWNNNYKTGETTRIAGLFALHFYNIDNHGIFNT